MAGEKENALNNLNHTLTSVENELLKRKSDRDDEIIDTTLAQVNQLAADGDISICGCDGDGEPDKADPDCGDSEG